MLPHQVAQSRHFLGEGRDRLAESVLLGTQGFELSDRRPASDIRLHRVINERHGRPARFLRAANRIWYVQNRQRRYDPAPHLDVTKQLAETVQFVPRDGDDASVFADSSNRVITVERFEAHSQAAR